MFKGEGLGDELDDVQNWTMMSGAVGREIRQ